MMKYKILLFLVFSVILSGCIQTKQTYYLNPNGSGKVNLTYSTPLDIMGMSAEGEKYKDLNKEINKILFADGIETWKDVEIEVLPDSSRLIFNGTAYFPDYTKLKGEPFEVKVQLLDIGDGKYKFGLIPEESDDEDVQELTTDNEMEAEVEANNPYAGMSKEEKMKVYRNQFKQAMGMMRGFMGNMEVDQQFVLPGNISKNNGLKQLNDHTVQFFFNGDSIVSAMERIVYSDEMMEQLIDNDPDAQNFDQLMESPEAEKLAYNAMLGIKSDDPTVVISSVRPAFNYKEEVKAAAKEFEELKGKYKN